MGRARKFFKNIGNFVTSQFEVTQSGGAGDDTLNGKNLFRNKLYGNEGNDILKAFGAHNELYGGAGDDFLRAVGISNVMSGGEGNDEIVGLGLRNEMSGGTGDDMIRGVGAWNDMRGDQGNDQLIGIGAYNAMNGGADNDLLVGLGAYNDMQGGTGSDRLVGIGAFNRMDGGEGDDIIVAVGAVNRVYGGEGRDLITAIGGVNVLDGGTGNDTIVAGGGVNVVNGGDGNDVMVSVGGGNVMHGDAGNDIMVAAAAVATVQDGGTGDDTMISFSRALNVQDGGDGNDKMIAYAEIANVQNGGAGDDLMVANGIGNIQNGDAGNDVMVGLGGQNFQFGGAGSDTITGIGAGNTQSGGDGDDILFGFGQLNVQSGDAGDDILVGLGATGNLQSGGAGNDMLFGVGTLNVQHGGADDDVMVAIGRLNVQIGDEGNDMAFAVGDASLQLGGAGNDVMVGLGKANIQHGGAGDDILVAVGKGNLQMGSSGSDIIVGLGKGNVQFAGDLLDLVPEELEIDGKTQDDLGTHVTETAAGVERNVLVAAGKGNLQVGDSGRDIAIGLGETNVQKLGAGNDVGIAPAKKASFQFGESGKDVLVNMQFTKNGGTFQSGGGDDDTMITFFGGANSKPMGVQMGNSGNDIMAMISQDFFKELTTGSKPASGSTSGSKSGGVTFQSGGSGDDTFLDLATGTTLRSGGAGNDTFFSLGKGGIAFGGEGNDLMVGGYKASSFYAGGAGNDTMMDLKSFVSIQLTKHLIHPAEEFVARMADQVIDGILDRIQFTIPGLEGTFDGIAAFLDALALNFPGVDLPDIDFSFDLGPALDGLAKLLDALNLDLPLDDIAAALQAKIAGLLDAIPGEPDLDLLDGVLGAVSDTVRGLIDQVSTTAMNMAKVAELAFGGVIDTILDGMELVVDGVEGVIRGAEAIAEYLANGVEGAIADLLDTFTINLPDLSLGFDIPGFDIMDHIGAIGDAILNALPSFDFSAPLDFATHIGAAIGDVLKSIADAVSLDGLRELMDHLADGFSLGIDGIAAFFEDMPDFGAILDALNVTVPDLGSLPDVIGALVPTDIEDLVTKLGVIDILRDGDNLFGGDGDDTFGIASEETEAFGGAGNDTYRIDLNLAKHVEISELAADTEMLAPLGIAADAITAFDGGDAGLVSEAGGVDVVELNKFGGVSASSIYLTLVPEEILIYGGSLIVTVVSGLTAPKLQDRLDTLFDFDDSVTTLSQKTKLLQGRFKAISKDMTTIILADADVADARIETLRLTGIGESVEIDLAGAYDAGLFGVVPLQATDTRLNDFKTVNTSGQELLDDMVQTVANGTEVLRDAVADLATDIKNAGADIIDSARDLRTVEVEEAPDQEVTSDFDETTTDADFLTEDEIAARDNDLSDTEGSDFTAPEEGVVEELPDLVPVRINETPISAAYKTETIALADGTFMVLFAADETSGPHRIHAQRVDASGQKIGDGVLLETDEVNLLNWEAVSLGNNEFALRSYTFGAGEHHFAVDEAGAITKLDDPADGTFFKAGVKQIWLANGNHVQINGIHDTNHAKAFITVTKPDGTTTVSGKFANSDHMRQGDIVALASGGFAVAFTHSSGDHDIWMQIFDENGDAITDYLTPADPRGVSTTHHQPQLAALSDGTMLLAFNKDEGADEVRVLHLSETGEQIGEHITLEGARSFPSVVVQQDGTAAFTYAMPDGEIYSVLKVFDLDLEGTEANDLIDAGLGNDSAAGGEGDDAIFGGLGADSLSGEAGDDFLDGGEADDTLDGGADDDILIGGAGNDLLTGGEGADTFVFEAGAGETFGLDTVTDFTAGEDMIDLLGLTVLQDFSGVVIAQDGADAVVDTGTGVIRLKDTDAASVSESDFAHAGNTVGEYGSVDIDHGVTSVKTLQSYENPVVVAFVKTMNGDAFVEARVSNVTATGFDIRLQETEAQDGQHAAESVQFMVVEAGRHILSNGAVIEAGTVDTGAVYQALRKDAPADVAFEGALSGEDTRVFASVMTANDPDFVTARVDDVTAEGFKVSMAEQDAASDGHRSETIGFVAFQDGDFGAFSTGGLILEEQRASTPDEFHFAEINAIGDADTAVLRQDLATGEGFMQEEQSLDPELDHGLDTIAFLTFQQDDGLLLI